ncbi:hypothetical protein ACR732_24735, partial [Comamonas thiooxydans]
AHPGLEGCADPLYHSVRRPHLRQLKSEPFTQKFGHAQDGFTPQQANDIHAFVKALTPEIRSVVVHCEGGYSRSCGVVLALHNIYGFAVNASSLSQANRSVVTTIEVTKR